MKPQKMPHLLTPEDVAARLGVSLRTLMNMEKRGDIPPGVHIGRAKRHAIDDAGRLIAYRLLN